MKKTLKNTVNFAPNPASNNISISNPTQLDLEYTIVDLLGKTVIKNTKTTATNQPINLESLKSGVYLLQINNNGNTITKKLVKQ